MEKDLSNAGHSAMPLDLIERARARLLSPERGNQLGEIYDIEDAPEIIGKRGPKPCTTLAASRRLDHRQLGAV